MNRHPNGRWTKGQSANPAGRPPSPYAIAEILRQRGPDYIKRIQQIAYDTKVGPAVRLQALTWLFERGHGKLPLIMSVHDPARAALLVELVAQLGSVKLDRSLVGERVVDIEQIDEASDDERLGSDPGEV